MLVVNEQCHTIALSLSLTRLSEIKSPIEKGPQGELPRPGRSTSCLDACLKHAARADDK